MHLIIDGYSNNSEIMQDEKFIYDLLNSYPAKIGMTKIAGPHVFRYVGTKPEDWGISGIVFIAESHICIHLSNVVISTLTFFPAVTSILNKLSRILLLNSSLLNLLAIL
jgi:hypothetical protein